MSLLERAQKYFHISKGPTRTFDVIEYDGKKCYVCSNGIAVIEKCEVLPARFLKSKIVDNTGDFTVVMLSEKSVENSKDDE